MRTYKIFFCLLAIFFYGCDDYLDRAPDLNLDENN